MSAYEELQRDLDQEMRPRLEDAMQEDCAICGKRMRGARWFVALVDPWSETIEREDGIVQGYVCSRICLRNVGAKNLRSEPYFAVGETYTK